MDNSYVLLSSGSVDVHVVGVVSVAASASVAASVVVAFVAVFCCGGVSKWKVSALMEAKALGFLFFNIYIYMYCPS